MSTGNKEIRIPDALSSQVTLRQDEEVLGVIRFQWLNYLKQLIAGGVFVIFGIYALAVQQISFDGEVILQDATLAGIGALLLGLFLSVSVYVTKMRSGFVITDQRVVESQGGLLATRTKSVLLNEIRSIETIQSGPLQPTLRGKGALQIDTGAGELTVPARDAKKLTRLIRTQMDRLEKT